MKANEIREKSTEDLNVELAELSNELFKLRFQNATHNLDNPAQLKHVRRDIARVKTILREREISLENK